LAAAAGMITTIFLNDPDTTRILGPLGLGAVVAFVTGVGFLWLNVTILTVGLWFRPQRSWAIGACLATPVVLAAVGFGYSIFLAYPLK
jgi:hypothetical protein